MVDDHQMDLLRKRHKRAIDRFGQHYEPSGWMGEMHLTIGHQSFGLKTWKNSEDDTPEYREWYGIMLCVALQNLVEMHAPRPSLAQRATGWAFIASWAFLAVAAILLALEVYFNG